MPNAFAHIGAQGLITRLLLKNADPKWVCIGAVLPDIPWILRRFVLLFYRDVPYEMSLYLVVQGSLSFSLLLGCAISLLTSRFWTTFAILGLNSLFHLFLDACETKWGSGVHLLAPLSWRSINFGLFWPESPAGYLLTAMGIAYFIGIWRRAVTTPVEIKRRQTFCLSIAAALFAAYLFLPLTLLNGLLESDSRFLKTMHPEYRQERPGRYVEFDRVPYVRDPSGGVLQLAKEVINAGGSLPGRSATVSVRGTFTAPDRIHIHEYRVHARWFRDGASYLGLALVALLWLYALARRRAVVLE